MKTQMGFCPPHAAPVDYYLRDMRTELPSEKPVDASPTDTIRAALGGRDMPTIEFDGPLTI